MGVAGDLLWGGGNGVAVVQDATGGRGFAVDADGVGGGIDVLLVQEDFNGAASRQVAVNGATVADEADTNVTFGDWTGCGCTGHVETPNPL